MAEINGESTAPGAGKGSAYILGANVPSALSVIMNGQRAKQIAAQREAAAQAKADAERSKQFMDDSKYQQDGSVYFGQALNDQVYQPLTGKLNTVYAQPALDALSRAQLTRPLLQNVNNETVQSKAKTDYIKNTLDGFKNNPLYDAKYATEHLTKNLPAGTLPSQFDEEAWKANLLGDEKAYNEGEVVSRTSKKLLDDVTSRVSQAGALGGKHVMDQTRGQLMAFDSKGLPVKNADGGYKIALTKEVDTMLDSDPLFKLKTDARVAAYEAKREASIVAHAADPSVSELPAMSRRGHHAQMIEPLLHYDQTHDETLIRPPTPRAVKAGAAEESYTPAQFDGKQDVQYAMPNSPETTSATFSGVGNPASGIPDVTKYTAATTSPRPGYAVYGPPIAPPMDVSKSGKKTYKKIKFTPDNYAIMGSSGTPEVRRNNTQSIEGEAGELNRAFVNNNGEHIYPKTSQEGLDLIRQGKAKLRVQFDVNTEKNEKLDAQLGPTTDALLQLKNSDLTPKYATRDLAEAEARRKLSTGTVRTTHLLTPGKNANIIEGAFGPKYRQLQAELNQTNQRLRAEGLQQQPAPAPKTTGVNFGGAAAKPNYKKAGTTPTGIKW